ncbi:hypothetical protein CICLE_v10010252mg, partial [Citrus x clementina]
QTHKKSRRPQRRRKTREKNAAWCIRPVSDVCHRSIRLCIHHRLLGVRQCAQRFSAVGIRYGKYCGVGWSGCPGEKPCDDLDACCKIHDECVDKKGLTNIKCHEKFKRCIKKVQKSAKVGFSRECPYDTVVPTMVQGMDMAILLSQLGGSKFEL